MPAQTAYTRDPDSGVEGQLGAGLNNVKTMYNGDSANITFARAVVRDTSVAIGTAAKLPAGTTPKPAGIVAFSQVYENGPNGELATDGVKPGGQLSVLRTGRVLGRCEGGCTTGDRLWVRYAGGTLGALRASDAGSSTCMDATAEGEWQETAVDGALAWLEVDFLNK